MFVGLLIDAALRHALNKVESMSEEELISAIKDEEARKKMLTEELKGL
jgi:hypothetical protein